MRTKTKDLRHKHEFLAQHKTTLSHIAKLSCLCLHSLTQSLYEAQSMNEDFIKVYTLRECHIRSIQRAESQFEQVSQ